MKERRNTKKKLQLMDLVGLRNRIRDIQKRKAGIYARRRAKHPGKNR